MLVQVPKTHDFEHLIEHAMSCTLEKSDEDVSSCDVLSFETMHELIVVE